MVRTAKDEALDNERKWEGRWVTEKLEMEEEQLAAMAALKAELKGIATGSAASTRASSSRSRGGAKALAPASRRQLTSSQSTGSLPLSASAPLRRVKLKPFDEYWRPKPQPPDYGSLPGTPGLHLCPALPSWYVYGRSGFGMGRPRPGADGARLRLGLPNPDCAPDALASAPVQWPETSPEQARNIKHMWF
eukprot:TRINITY_DN29174_c0_g1_i2.p1 TRINITY_DN29174_c0_g1~~TRINITY_DN29174_c0_g1_i2.p1  ORF type:complete len:191 (-),score=27.48 TRINITY_DN29174_c0_g1_i2:178-750(-)